MIHIGTYPAERIPRVVYYKQNVLLLFSPARIWAIKLTIKCEMPAPSEAEVHGLSEQEH